MNAGIAEFNVGERAMKRTVWMLAALLVPLEGAAQVMNQLSVDREGQRVALTGPPSVWSGGNSESRLFRRAAGGWTEDGRVPSPGWQRVEFIGDDLLIEGRRHSIVDGELTPKSGPLGVGPVAIGLGDSGPLIRGDRVLMGIEAFPHSPLRILQADGEGWTTLAELPPPADLPWVMGPVHAAFDEQRVAVLLMPLAERCGLLIYESGGNGWQRTGPLFPPVCGERAGLGGGSISLEGERLVIGAYPDPNMQGRAGQLAVHARGTGEWLETARIERPTVEDDYTDDGMLPYAFGHRVQLVAGRIHVGTGYQIIRSHQDGVAIESSVIHNGVMVFAEGSDGWSVERHLVHAHPTALFGTFFEVRGERLFIDSPLEDAAYVFARSEAGYRMEARLPAEPAPPGTEGPTSDIDIE